MAGAPFAITTDPAMSMFGCRTAPEVTELFIANQNLENWMKLVKTSAIAVAISALLAGPVLAQGASSDTQIRGGAQGKTQMQGGASGSIDEDANAPAGGQKGRREDRHEGHRRSRQRRAPRNCQDHGRGGYPSSDRPISATRKKPVSSAGLLSKQNSGRHGRPEFFCACS